MEKIDNLLDGKGYVILHRVDGTELDIVNASRVSFDKESHEMTDRDANLIRYLLESKPVPHMSPFRQVGAWFELYAPLMVCRQWWKHVVASAHIDDQIAHNESSRRYVTEEPTFYVPLYDEWRVAPSNKKQGSGGGLNNYDGTALTANLLKHVDMSVRLYEDAIARGTCVEQARLFLPAYGLYVRWRWNASLNAIINFLNQRLDEHAQKEIQAYALAVEGLIAPHFPITFETLKEMNS